MIGLFLASQLNHQPLKPQTRITIHQEFNRGNLFSSLGATLTVKNALQWLKENWDTLDQTQRNVVIKELFQLLPDILKGMDPTDLPDGVDLTDISKDLQPLLPPNPTNTPTPTPTDPQPVATPKPKPTNGETNNGLDWYNGSNSHTPTVGSSEYNPYENTSNSSVSGLIESIKENNGKLNSSDLQNTLQKLDNIPLTEEKEALDKLGEHLTPDQKNNLIDSLTEYSKNSQDNDIKNNVNNVVSALANNEKLLNNMSKEEAEKIYNFLKDAGVNTSQLTNLSHKLPASATKTLSKLAKSSASLDKIATVIMYILGGLLLIASFIGGIHSLRLFRIRNEFVDEKVTRTPKFLLVSWSIIFLAGVASILGAIYG